VVPWDCMYVLYIPEYALTDVCDGQT
jgi:hypothetical protein